MTVYSYTGVLLEDVGAEDGGQCSGVPALLLERSHAGQEAAQETQEAVVQLGKLLQEVLQVSTQLLVIAVICKCLGAKHRLGFHLTQRLDADNTAVTNNNNNNHH